MLLETEALFVRCACRLKRESRWTRSSTIQRQPIQVSTKIYIAALPQGYASPQRARPHCLTAANLLPLCANMRANYERRACQQRERRTRRRRIDFRSDLSSVGSPAANQSNHYCGHDGACEGETGRHGCQAIEKLPANGCDLALRLLHGVSFLSAHSGARGFLRAYCSRFRTYGFRFARKKARKTRAEPANTVSAAPAEPGSISGATDGPACAAWLPRNATTAATITPRITEGADFGIAR